MKPISKILLWILPLALYGLLLARPINLVTADLGRHIKNGEVILSNYRLLTTNHSLLTTNFYSYTSPGYPTINHHWLSGVVFYAVWKLAGFVGIHLFFIVTSLTTLLIFLAIARNRAGPGLAALLTVPIMPLLLERDEIRPEIFSYLFSGIFFWLLLKYKDGGISWKKLLILPALQILWVNLHVYFFLGPAIIGIFLLERIVLKDKQSAKHLLVILGLTSLASLINPFGLNGVLAPLSIFKNFGYRLAENQPVWFIEKILPNPNFLVFKIVFAMLIVSFLIRILRPSRLQGQTLDSPRFGLGEKYILSDLVFAIGFSAAGWLAIRNFALFGLFALPIAAGNTARGFSIKQQTDQKLGHTVVITLTLVALATLSGELWKIYPHPLKLGLGLESGNENSMIFFKENRLTGPIFNNYDIGGYLIFHLYPQERVFVDNRPEAYPAEFFEKIYIPMQEDEDVWQEKLKEYGFKTIIFSHGDYTPWGQAFLARRLNDPQWQVVFKDSRVIIFARTAN